LRPPPRRGNFQRIVTAEESELYRKIIAEQLTLQDLLKGVLAMKAEPMAEGKRLSVARAIKAQRAVLSRLWERAHAIKAQFPE
jgi:hypothetical protein